MIYYLRILGFLLIGILYFTCKPDQKQSPPSDPKENVPDAIRITGKENVKVEDVMILGGGQTGFLLARELEKQYNVKIIESNVDKSQELAERLKKSLVIKGDGRDAQPLFDAVI